MEQKFNGDFVVGDEYVASSEQTVVYMGSVTGTVGQRHVFAYKEGSDSFVTDKTGLPFTDHFPCIIRHIKPKKNGEGYLNVFKFKDYKDIFIQPRKSRRDADKSVKYLTHLSGKETTRIACIRFTYEEGQFDD